MTTLLRLPGQCTYEVDEIGFVDMDSGRVFYITTGMIRCDTIGWYKTYTMEVYDRSTDKWVEYGVGVMRVTREGEGRIITENYHPTTGNDDHRAFRMYRVKGSSHLYTMEEIA